jgi:hypothetical protein
MSNSGPPLPAEDEVTELLLGCVPISLFTRIFVDVTGWSLFFSSMPRILCAVCNLLASSGHAQKLQLLSFRARSLPNTDRRKLHAIRAIQKVVAAAG